MLKFLIEREFKQIRRNPFLPRVIVAFPFMALWILPMAANFEVRNVRLSVVDNSHSTYSSRLVRKVASSGYFKLANLSSNYSQALRDVELDRADVVLEIPPRFEENLVREGASSVMISANTVNGTRGGLGSAFLASVVGDFAAEVHGEWRQGTGTLAVPSFGIVPQFRYNPHLRYPVFMVPALMVMLMTLICGFLPALNIVSEKERGTIEQINVTPVSRLAFIMSKLIPYWIIGFVVLTICFGVARLFYGLIPKGNLYTIYLFASVYVLALSGFGLVISNFAKSIQQAMFMMFFFVMTFIFMSGLYTPVNSMPQWAQNVSIFSPLKYFILVMRLVYLKGSGIGELTVPFGALCGFALFFNTLAVVTYRKRS
jgi:ABC-2 type transport system permease protein